MSDAQPALTLLGGVPGAGTADQDACLDGFCEVPGDPADPVESGLG